MGLRQRFVETLKLDEEHAIFPEDGDCFAAMGAALCATDYEPVLFEDALKKLEESVDTTTLVDTMPPLFQDVTEYGAFCARHNANRPPEVDIKTCLLYTSEHPGAHRPAGETPPDKKDGPHCTGLRGGPGGGVYLWRRNTGPDPQPGGISLQLGGCPVGQPLLTASVQMCIRDSLKDVKDGTLKGEVGVEQAAHQDTNKQGGVDLLGDQGQGDGDDGGQQGESGGIEVASRGDRCV